MIALLVIILSLSSLSSCNAQEQQQQQQYVPVRVVNENDTPIKLYHYDSNTEYINVFGERAVEVAGKETTIINSHPGHVFVSYNIYGIRLDKYMVITGYNEGEQIITIKDSTHVEAIFHNGMPEHIGTMDVYWLDFDNMAEELNAEIPVDQQVRFQTKPDTKYAVYNEDRSIRIEYEITAAVGQSQLVIIDTRVDLLITNLREEKVQVYWKEVSDDGEMATIHPIGYVNGPGGMFSIKSEPNHTFVAYTLTKNGNRKNMISTFTVSAKMGEKETFVIEKDEDKEL